MARFMRAVDVKNGKGPVDALFINDHMPIPSPAEGQALVKIRAFGVNRMDLIQREGQYPVPPQASSTLGVEFSGTIEAFGSGTHGTFQVGDAVFGLAYGGAYAQYVAVSTRMLLHKPEYLSWEQAAGVPEAWIAATQVLHFVLQFAAGKSVLWHAGASAVSIAGIQLSWAAGASAVYATVGTREKHGFLEKKVGVTRAFNRKEEDWRAELLQATDGKGVDMVVDCIGAQYFEKNLDVLTKDGRLCMIGLMGGVLVKDVDLSKIIFNRLRIEGSTLRARDENYQGLLRDKLETYLPKFESGELKIYIDTVLPMEDIAMAHKQLEENMTMGKIICTVS